MSAWIVSKDHIDALVVAGLQAGSRYYGSIAEFRWDVGANGIGTLDYETADELGIMLWNENLRSIHHRYPDTQESDELYPGRVGFHAVDVPAYVFPFHLVTRPRLDVVSVLKAIACYEYQSCEHPEWNSSSAKAYCEALRKSLVNDLEGYEEAPWGIDDIREIYASRVQS